MKRKEKKGYSYFKTKIFLKGLAVALLACIATGVFYQYVWKNQGGNWLVTIFHDVFMLDWGTSRNIYHQVFVNNEKVIWILCAALLFFLPCWCYLMDLTKYFKKIDQGIDALLEEKAQEITLPPELSELEGKLNTVRQTLEKRTLEAKLAEQRKNDLVMYLAHDIRTPLTSVIGYLSLLDEAKDMPQEMREKYTHITLDKANRLEVLVNEFFEITRYNLQQIPLQKENIDLYYMLVQLTEEFYPITSRKGNSITLQAREDLTVNADPTKLARVVSNVLKNAAAYADPDSEIVISAGQMDGVVKITVENHGPTIPKEKLASIFERFYRIDDARSTGSGGAGLGLAIAKEIVTLHGGDIQAESTGGITRFTVTLPAGEGNRSEV